MINPENGKIANHVAEGVALEINEAITVVETVAVASLFIGAGLVAFNSVRNRLKDNRETSTQQSTL